MTTNNVILFPGIKREIEPQITIENVKENITDVMDYHIDESINMISTLLIDSMNRLGFELSDKNDMKDIALILESIRSYFSKKYDLDHPFHKISEEWFDEKDDIITLNDKVYEILNISSNVAVANT